MNPLLSVTAIALAVSISTVAHARSWWVLNFQEDVCESAAHQPIHTPEAAVAFIRATGYATTPSVLRDDDNNVTAVETPTDSHTSIYWFTTPELCESFRADAEKDGLVTNPRDLR